VEMSFLGKCSTLSDIMLQQIQKMRQMRMDVNDIVGPKYWCEKSV
jgi:hypothetical protein